MFRLVPWIQQNWQWLSLHLSEIFWREQRFFFVHKDEIKIEYKIQLQLYAALLERKQIDLGISPVRLPKKAILKNPYTGHTVILEPLNLINKGLKGYIYGERGVWRPGDTLYLTFMLEDKKQVPPKHFEGQTLK